MRRKIRVVGAMIEQDGKYLITQRPPTASLPNLWEFPGGRVEAGETDEEALARPRPRRARAAGARRACYSPSSLAMLFSSAGGNSY